MSVYIYGKMSENLDLYDSIIRDASKEYGGVFVTVENRRSFRELELIKNKCTDKDIVIIGGTASLGMNNSEIANQLSWFISKKISLVICNVPTTYEYGTFQPMNRAVLQTILQTIVNSGNIVQMPRRTNSGRNPAVFPEQWDELYAEWENKRISSKEFICLSGLKKATFYNLLSEYKRIQEVNEQYRNKWERVI